MKLLFMYSLCTFKTKWKYVYILYLLDATCVMFLLLIDSLKIYTPYIHVYWGFFPQTNSYLQNKVWICERTERNFAKLK